jgi:hypothetical protein
VNGTDRGFAGRADQNLEQGGVNGHAQTIAGGSGGSKT